MKDKIIALMYSIISKVTRHNDIITYYVDDGSAND